MAGKGAEREGVAVILAAGQGTRMRSRLAKVLHPLLGRPMAAFPVQAAQEAGLRAVVVVHHQEEAVREALAATGAQFVRQERTLGTGDAVRSALPALPARGTVVVLNGDAPLLTADTLRRLLAAHGDGDVTVLTAELPDAGSYGRLVRDDTGRPLRIVEAAEAAPAELAIQEINTGIYAFDAHFLHTVVPDLPLHQPKGEIYLTDALALAAARGRAQAIRVADPGEVEGVNDRWQLAAARKALLRRRLQALSDAGVTFEDPDTTVIEADVTVGQDAIVGPGAILQGATRIGAGARIGAYCVLKDTIVEETAEIHPYSHCEGAIVRSGASVGPFARLREAAVIGEEAKIGNFVEVKKTDVGRGAKASHLTYLGDATVGPGANIGAGTITCNYDGYNKHRTAIGEGAFIGSNTALVAPVTVGAGAIVGAGSTITKEVPADALGIGRGRQENIPSYAARFRERQKPKGK